jgi:hypothetical protein
LGFRPIRQVRLITAGSVSNFVRISEIEDDGDVYRIDLELQFVLEDYELVQG